MSRLRPFSFSNRVTPEEARQDGIYLEMGDWYIQGIGNSLGTFVDLLGPQPKAIENGLNVNAWTNILTTLPVATLEPEFFGWMFNRPAGNFDHHTEMDLRSGGSGSAPRAGAPLAKGKLHFADRRPEGEHMQTTRRRQLRLTLFLNPTRYLRHQRSPSNVTSPPNAWNLSEPNLRTLSIPRRRTVGNESANADIETSLDGNDNVLLSSRSLSFGRPEAWPIHLRRYLQAVEDQLNEEFKRAADLAQLHIESGPKGFSHTPYYSLKKVETYFEFASHNATQLLRRLQPALESIGLGKTTRSYPLGLFVDGQDQTNARSILITLGSGRLLRVYAKTTHRVRFEIIHDPTKASVYNLLHAERKGHTTENREHLLAWFRFLAIDAAAQLNNVFSNLERRFVVPMDSADTYEFYAEVFGVVRNARRAKDLMKLLVENGCLRVGRLGTDFLPEIQQLRRTGFLKNEGSDVVTERFGAALDTLRMQAGLPPLNPL